MEDEIPGAADLSVSVNLSSKQFAQIDLAKQIDTILGRVGLPARFLKLEITESHVLENSDQAIRTMTELREIGVELSLDDFGTGYSSLSYLHRLPANYLKIDRSFIYQMGSSNEDKEIVSTIVKLAHNLKKAVIAEGIETLEQVRQLQLLGCEFGQGYYFCKALPAKTARKLIKDPPMLRHLNSVGPSGRRSTPRPSFVPIDSPTDTSYERLTA